MVLIVLEAPALQPAGLNFTELTTSGYRELQLAVTELQLVLPGLTIGTPPGGKLEDGADTGGGEVQTVRVVPLRAVVTSYQVLRGGLLAVAVQLSFQSFYQPGPSAASRGLLPRHWWWQTGNRWGDWCFW